jgi:hypothetical protein
VRAIAILLLLACETSSEPTAWPSWPDDEAAARALIAEHTRASRPRRELTAGDVIAAIDEGAFIAGWRPIVEALRPHDVVIMGMHHDAHGQHAAFRRLFGSADDRRTLALELFDADGRWDGASQRGDQRAIDLYLERGDRSSLDAVRTRLERGAYTAWKYDLIDEILAIVIDARAGSRRVFGCDAPPSLRTTFDEATALRMRELHCALALRDAPRPIAILIGDAHTAPEGLPSFMPGAIVVRPIGGRRSDAGIEPALAERLAVTDPLLVTIRGERVLILPDDRLRADGEISRVRERPASAGALSIDAEAFTVRVDGHPAEDHLAVGDHTFVATNGERRIAGALAMIEDASLELVVLDHSVLRTWTTRSAELP